MHEDFGDVQQRQFSKTSPLKVIQDTSPEISSSGKRVLNHFP
jgi:hypothetical protein